MKVNIEIEVDLTPKEARSLMGMPDLDPMWDKVMADTDDVKQALAESIKSNVLRMFDPMNLRKNK